MIFEVAAEALKLADNAPFRPLVRLQPRPPLRDHLNRGFRLVEQGRKLRQQIRIIMWEARQIEAEIVKQREDWAAIERRMKAKSPWAS